MNSISITVLSVLFVLCMLFFLNRGEGAARPRFGSESGYIPSPYIAMSDRIEAKVIKALCNRYNMSVMGTGEGFIDHINLLSVRFQLRGMRSRDELRRILIDCVEEYLKAFNADEEIRPHLK